MGDLEHILEVLKDNLAELHSLSIHQVFCFENYATADLDIVLTS